MAANESAIPTPATPDVCTAKILVEGAEIPGTIHVQSVVVMREVNRIPSATLHIQDGEASRSTFAVGNADYFIPGKKLEIKLGYRSQEDTVFKGIVIKYSVKIRKNSSFLIVECRDEAVKMTCGLKSHYFAGKKDSDILEEIIGRYGLSKDVEATKPDLKEIVQYEATDWDFVLCRAEANGLLVLVEDGKIRIAKPDTKQEPVVNAAFGFTLLELDAEIDARLQSPGIKAHSWNATEQKVAEAEAAEPATTKNGNLTPDALSKVMGGAAHLLRHGGKLSTPELKAWADGALQRERLGKVRGRAQFQGFAGVMPGKTIDIQGIGERMQGKMLIAGVRHQFARGNWETDVQFGLSPEPFAETYNLRPLPAAGLLPAVSGLRAAVVTKLEGDPDGENRIKVRLPLISEQEEGTWARISTLDAGNNRGTYFRPELGDEVIVGFLHDDPRHPVVLGMCHSSKKPAPVPPSDKNHHKGYVSREKLKITFDDEKKVMAFETFAGNKITLSEADKAITIKDQNGNKITLDKKGITIESTKDIVFKAKKDVKAEGVNFDLAAKSAFKATGTSSAELSGASTSVKGSATTTIQGGTVRIN
ncbi:type VI secretion system tip protein VgrG [Hymenobacter jejuensis]|uniref:Type VI secretion system tip protein VgrG n=1 Tax=Hymenobacter jejuensis TaxID=2502781 RepID=A0A5B8A4G1_9BACT|nr:type VI secretion system tip protein VgrG [Hymenobacter jejuensis]QDA61596.1 type VI secretion system tip protein VgrG [Hymenobacter jejuensis]